MSDNYETNCDHGYFTVSYMVGKGDLCVKDGECPVCRVQKANNERIDELIAMANSLRE